MKLSAGDIEIALSSYFNTRQNYVIPNVKDGFRHIRYEIDVMVVTKAGYAYDVEIKVDAGDLKRDLKKHKWSYCREQNYFRKSYFAIPEELISYQEFIPDFAGILIVSFLPAKAWFHVKELRKATINTSAKYIRDDELRQLGRLCMMRLWDCKELIRKRKLEVTR